MNLTKRGQGVFGMSFGTIFSIIIIIFIVIAAFIAIRHFAGLSKCSNIGLYYEDLREEVRDAWTSTSGKYQDEFTAKIPKKGLFGAGIEYVCFGTLSATPHDTLSDEKQQDLRENWGNNPSGPDNVFLYPPDNGCDAGLRSIVLKCGNSDCVTTNGKFFCKEVQDDGAVSVWMVKQPSDYKITLRPDQP
jgi:hypothetical protein